MSNVLIIDDHPVFRQGLRQIIAEEFPGTNCGEAGDSDQAMTQLARNKWDMVVLDISMPGKNGLQILSDIQMQVPDCRVLVLTMHPQEQFAQYFQRLGAAGYITKNRARTELVRAFRNVLKGKTYPARSAERVRAVGSSVADCRHHGLSEREFAVMIALAEGKRPTDIARELDLSIKTVSTYKRRILDKMHMQASAELTRYAIRSGLIDS
jgi:two-component system invasion response regulator UvrY